MSFATPLLFMTIRDVPPVVAYSVKDFGAVGDDKNDDLPAFNKALAFLKSLPGNGKAPLYVPPGNPGYFLNGNLNVHDNITMFGGGSGEPLVNTILRFSANNWGIVLHERRTTDDGGGNAFASSGLGDAAGATIEDLTVWGGGAQSIAGPYTNPVSTNRAAPGIWIRTTFCTLRNVGVAFCSGNGIQILAYSGATGANAGQANLNYLYNCNTQYNAGAGHYIEGSDANACLLVGCSSISNGASGFEDNSFLGNTHIGHHTRDNGAVDPTVTGAPVGVCTFGGHNYTVAGTDKAAAASTTVPGTDPTVWAQYDGVGAAVIWVPGLKWRCSAPYLGLTTNGVANNLWLGCYTEGSQPPSLGATRNLFLGGSVGFVVGGTHVDSSYSSLTSFTGFAAPSTEFIDPTLTTVVYGGPSPFKAHGAGIYTLQYLANTQQLNFGMDATGTLLQETIGPTGNPGPPIKEVGLGGDTSARGPGHYYFSSLFVGPLLGSPCVQFATLDAFPGQSYLNRTQANVGGRFYYPTVTPGYPEGFVCKTAGALAAGISTLATVQPFGRVLGSTTFATLLAGPAPVSGQLSCISNCSTTTPGAAADGAGANEVLVAYIRGSWKVVV